MIDFKLFGKNLSPNNKQEAFLLAELEQMNGICRNDELLSSLIAPELNVSVNVIHDDLRVAPIHDDTTKAIVYHRYIVDNQMANKEINGINYYTQSSLFHELIHAEQVRNDMHPAKM